MTRPALEGLEPGGVPQASGASLLMHVPVFPPQEGLPALLLPQLWRRGCVRRRSSVMSCG